MGIIGTGCKVGCEFQLEKFSIKRSTREIVGPFNNLMLDTGLNRMGQGTWADRVAVGTGNQAPATGQTSLQALVASAPMNLYGSVNTGISGEDLFYSASTVMTFPAGTFNNVNLQEIAIGWWTGVFNASNRALIKDTLGNPVSLNVQSDEFLRITVTIKVYPNLTDVIGTMDLLDRSNNIISVHDTIIRPAQIASNSNIMIDTYSGCNNIIRGGSATVTNGNIGTNQQVPSGSYLDATTIVEETYVSNSFERLLTLNGGLNSFNAHGGSIRSVLLSTSLGRYQVQYDPPILKTSDKVLKLQYKIGWGRPA